MVAARMHMALSADAAKSNVSLADNRLSRHRRRRRNIPCRIELNPVDRHISGGVYPNMSIFVFNEDRPVVFQVTKLRSLFIS